MIAKLTGVLDSAGADWAIVDAGGVGYLVYCSARTLRRMPAPGGRVSLAIETHVREDHIHLYGFAEAAEQEWFRILLTVQGVGARLAIGILSALGPDQLAAVIAAQDRAAMTQAPGVGPKLAARLLTELKDKAAGLANIVPLEPAAAAGAGSGPVRDAVSALVNLGYRHSEAFGAVAGAARRLGDGAGVETLIKAGLKELSA